MGTGWSEGRSGREGLDPRDRDERRQFNVVDLVRLYELRAEIPAPPEHHWSKTMPVGTTARTGQTCPESGVWKVVSNPSTTAPIAKGNKMPPYNNQAVTWQLIQLA